MLPHITMGHKLHRKTYYGVAILCVNPPYTLFRYVSYHIRELYIMVLYSPASLLIYICAIPSQSVKPKRSKNKDI